MVHNLNSNLANPQGMGTQSTGATHWWHQRITALILFICSIWLIFFISRIINQDWQYIISLLQKPYNLISFGLLVTTSLYHSMLGMRVIIEDYIHCLKLRSWLIIFLQLFCIITSLTFIIALVYTLPFS